MDDREFRNAMGKFATGVTVITTEVDGEPHGMTANAFMSVSLHPKLIMISIDNRANMLDKIKEANKFAVNILADHQKDLSMHFAGQTKDEREIDFQYIENIPVLDGTLASIACDVDNSYVVGEDRKSTRLNSSHVSISYAVFCLKKKRSTNQLRRAHRPTDPRARSV